MSAKYKYWLSDPTILYSDDKYLEFIPTLNMSRIEQLNAITRFCIYFIILSLLTNQNEIWIHCAILIIFLCVILHYVFLNDKNEIIKKQIPNENYENVACGTKTNKEFDDYTENDKFKNFTCRRPTADNPFMNPTINDFGVEYPPEACNADDDLIKDKIDSSFKEGLFMDVGDLFTIENSQRQFYTIPQMNPPDQTAFANWLYNSNDICKVDQTKCLKYEDLRYKRTN